MARYDQPSHLKATLRLLASRMRRGGGASGPDTPVPGRKLAVERHGIEVGSVRLSRYLAATRPSVMEATQSGNVLPATFSSTWETAIILELLAMEGAPFPSAGVIHLRSELISLRPMRVDDRFRCRVELDGIEPHARGWRLMLRGRNWNQAGQLCQENATEILVRGRQRNRPGGEGGSARQSSAATDEEGGGIGWQPRAEWRLPTNAGRRYARASGDYNPIHLWAWSARPLGFARPILHGHCALAMIARVLGGWGGEGPGVSPRRIDAAFRRPLLLPCRVRLEVQEAPEGGAVRFRLVDGGEEGAAAPRSYVEGSCTG